VPFVLKLEGRDAAAVTVRIELAWRDLKKSAGLSLGHEIIGGT
jgi:hypothetical protein